MNNRLLIIGLGTVTIWDTITTIYGTTIIIGDGTLQIVISILFSIILSGFLISTVPILKNPNNEDILVVGTKVLWALSLLYDIFTSFTGNFEIILGDIKQTASQIIIAIGITIFVCSAPIALSSLLYNKRY